MAWVGDGSRKTILSISSRCFAARPGVTRFTQDLLNCFVAEVRWQRRRGGVRVGNFVLTEYLRKDSRETDVKGSESKAQAGT